MGIKDCGEGRAKNSHSMCEFRTGAFNVGGRVPIVSQQTFF